MYIHRFLLVIVSVLVIALASCKESNPEAQAEILQAEEVVELDSAFIKFYNRFHKDSIFQLEHIQFPLSKNSQGELGENWVLDNWIMHNQFTDMGGMFRRDLVPIGSMVIEKIIDANGFFEMERRFAELSDGWMLIYYDVRNPSLQSGGGDEE